MGEVLNPHRSVRGRRMPLRTDIGQDEDRGQGQHQQDAQLAELAALAVTLSLIAA